MARKELDEVADALDRNFTSPNVPDSNMEAANVVDVIAGAGLNISRALKRLGLADAATPMGAIEAHAVEIRNAGEKIASAISELAEAVGRLSDK